MACCCWRRESESSTPLGRLIGALPKTSIGDVVYELFWNRDGYGTAAAAAIGEHPLMGVGIGRFTGLSTSYAQRALGRAIPADNAQNLWRHTLAEQGLIGLLPILWLTGLTVMAVFAGRVEGVDLVLRVMVCGLGVQPDRRLSHPGSRDRRHAGDAGRSGGATASATLIPAAGGTALNSLRQRRGPGRVRRRVHK